MFTPGLIASNFVRLDDTDILASAKYWTDNSDRILADLAGRLINRNLFAIELQNDPFPPERLDNLRNTAADLMKINPEHLDYYVFAGTISNLAYTPD
ncbi:MAG: phosphohydrolase, partial [Bacteroidia bacterium]|nr:phosphohydrolase [Bacteroidia bacterium]